MDKIITLHISYKDKKLHASNAEPTKLKQHIAC